MKIALLEISAGQTYPEREFSAEVIKVGRDPLACHLIFDQADWPMVSRRHAEFRRRDGRFLLADTGSSFGTFVDGERVVDPCEIRVGTQIQFGPGGPLLRVTELSESTSTQTPQPAESSLRRRPAEREQPVTIETRRDSKN